MGEELIFVICEWSFEGIGANEACRSAMTAFYRTAAKRLQEDIVDVPPLASTSDENDWEENVVRCYAPDGTVW